MHISSTRGRGRARERAINYRRAIASGGFLSSTNRLEKRAGIHLPHGRGTLLFLYSPSLLGTFRSYRRHLSPKTGISLIGDAFNVQLWGTQMIQYLHRYNSGLPEASSQLGIQLAPVCCVFDFSDNLGENGRAITQ